ncbi:MAG: BlaI/MecI/CopY family transcriptional regulator, partial [Bacteroidota bacterium]
NQIREVGYTTTLKIMQIMTEKEYVQRDTSQRTHIYKALLSEKKVKKDLVDRIVEGAFKGSAMQLVMQALGNQKPTKEELKELKALIKKIEKDNA